GRDVTAQKRTEELSRLEHGIARELAQAATATDGVRAALRLICDAEGWVTGEGDIEQLLRGSRVLWQAGKPVWSTDLPRAKGGRFATFAIPVVSQQKTIAMLA